MTSSIGAGKLGILAATYGGSRRIATLKEDQITCICDTREKLPLDLTPLKMVRGTLSTADYSIVGLEHVVAVERKSLQDMIGCIGYGRDRFEREMHRILAYPARLIVIEGHMAQIQLKQYRGEIHPNAVIGSLLGWMAKGVPIMFASDHAEAGKMVARFLFIVAKRRFSEAETFYKAVSDNS